MTKPVAAEAQRCPDCHHAKWLDYENRCKHLIPVEVDELYHETRCGHLCEFPAPQVEGVEQELILPEFALADLKLWMRSSLEKQLKYRGTTRSDSPVGEGYSYVEIPEWEMRQKQDLVDHAIKGVNALLTTAQPQPTPADEVEKRARHLNQYEISDLFLRWWKSQSLTSETERSRAIARVAYEAGMVEARRAQGTCTWTWDATDPDVDWETSCGQRLQDISGIKRYRFCLHCGKPLVEATNEDGDGK